MSEYLYNKLKIETEGWFSGPSFKDLFLRSSEQISVDKIDVKLIDRLKCDERDILFLGDVYKGRRKVGVDQALVFSSADVEKIIADVKEKPAHLKNVISNLAKICGTWGSHVIVNSNEGAPSTDNFYIMPAETQFSDQMGLNYYNGQQACGSYTESASFGVVLFPFKEGRKLYKALNKLATSSLNCLSGQFMPTFIQGLALCILQRSLFLDVNSILESDKSRPKYIKSVQRVLESIELLQNQSTALKQAYVYLVGLLKTLFMLSYKARSQKELFKAVKLNEFYVHFTTSVGFLHSAGSVASNPSTGLAALPSEVVNAPEFKDAKTRTIKNVPSLYYNLVQTQGYLKAGVAYFRKLHEFFGESIFDEHWDQSRLKIAKLILKRNATAAELREFFDAVGLNSLNAVLADTFVSLFDNGKKFVYDTVDAWLADDSIQLINHAWGWIAKLSVARMNHVFNQLKLPPAYRLDSVNLAPIQSKDQIKDAYQQIDQALLAHLFSKHEMLTEHFVEFEDATAPRKLAIPFIFSKMCVAYKDYDEISVSLIQQVTSEKVKGWYDLSKQLPFGLQWMLWEARAEQRDLEYGKTMQDFAEVFKMVNYGIHHPYTFSQLNGMHPNLFVVYSPYAPRGGFSVTAYQKICEEFNVENIFDAYEDPPEDYYPQEYIDEGVDVEIPTCNFFKKQSALALAMLYGADHAAAIAAIKERAAQANLSQERALIELGSFSMAYTAESAKLNQWRPLLLKYPSLLKIVSLGSIYSDVTEEDKLSENKLALKLVSHNYSGVPDELSIHMVHASKNHWSQETVDSFVEFCKNAKTKCMIPDVDYVAEGVRIRTLKAGDPVALYVGELSGCCQHINDGGGDEAAIQSFAEEWCSVLMLESASSGKLLAQSFLWLDESKKYVMMDSIESVLSTDNSSVRTYVIPAILNWADKMKEDHGLKIVISNATYGLTEEITSQLSASGKVKSIETPTSYDSLEYTDAGDSEAYQIKTTKKKKNKEKE